MHNAHCAYHIYRRVDTGLTEKTKLTEIRQFGPFSDFNSTLRNLRVLKYKFEIVTIVELYHILNLKKRLALYMQYKLSSILFKKTLRQFGPLPSNRSLPSIWSRTDSDGFRTLEIVKKYVYVFTLWVYSDYCIYRYISIHTHICILYVLRKGRQ